MRSGPKFRVGQMVRFVPGTHERAYGGQYEVVAKLPEERGEEQYRLKSTSDGHERIVRESQINGTQEGATRDDVSVKGGDVAPQLLTAPERMSLRRLVLGTAPVSIPIGHLSRFRRLGLTEPTIVGEAVTEKGQAEARRRIRAGE
jgi:hypothetical protein